MTRNSLGRSLGSVWITFLAGSFLSCATKGFQSETQLTSPESVACSACFPIETLPARLREKAVIGLMTLFDSEALYTAVGKIKPLTQEYDNFIFPQKSKYTEKDAKDFEAIVKTYHCTALLDAMLYRHRQKIEPGTISTSVLFFRTDSLDRLEQKYPLTGIAPTHPTNLQSKYEYLESQIFNGPNKVQALEFYGRMFGYPDYAVSFFVDAHKETQQTGQFINRELFIIPAFENRNPFSWVVPQGHKRNAEDLKLEEQTRPILDAYIKLRMNLPDGGPDRFLQSIRGWFSNGKGQCSPGFAEQKIAQSLDR